MSDADFIRVQLGSRCVAESNGRLLAISIRVTDNQVDLTGGFK